MITYFYSVQSEWLKRKRSATAWLTVTGAFFIPAIILAQRLIQHKSLQAISASPKVWDELYSQCWQYNAIFLLPMGIILASSLIAQLEYKNNGWKQLHTTPQSFTVIFFAKLTVILLMLLQFFVLFNVGIYLTGIVPALIFPNVSFPQQAFPLLGFLSGNSKFFISCLPILGLQYLLSIHVKNFIIPIGIGFALLIASIIALSWQYGYLIPYTYCPSQFLKTNNKMDTSAATHIWALAYFTIFTVVNYLLYIGQKSKG